VICNCREALAIGLALAAGLLVFAVLYWMSRP
jgi:hypothetical protein